MHRVKLLLDADESTCEMALVLIDRYVKAASRLNQLTISDIQRRHTYIVTQLEYLWVACVIIAIKLNCDIHYSMRGYANSLRVDMHILNTAERQVVLYLLHHSSLFVTSEHVSHVRACVGAPSLLYCKTIPAPVTTTMERTKTKMDAKRATKHWWFRRSLYLTS